MPPSDALWSNLEFNRAALSELLLVSTLLGGFSMTGVVALISLSDRRRLHRGLALLMTAATLLFIFATILVALLQPALNMPRGSLTDQQIMGLLRIGQWGVRMMLAATIALVTAIGMFGFVYSKRMGWLTLSMALGWGGAFVVYAARLAALLK